MQARASKKKVLDILECAAPSFAEVLRNAVSVWLEVQQALPLQRSNPHAAAAVQAVQAMERAASLCKTDQQRVTWMKQHVPGVIKVVTAHLIAQSDISLQRLLTVQQLVRSPAAWSQPDKPSQQLLDAIVKEQGSFWQLYALGRITACLAPIATAMKALSRDWGPNGSATDGQQRHRQQRDQQAELFMANVTLDLSMGHLGFQAAIDRVTQALEAMDIPLGNPYKGVKDEESLVKLVLRLHMPLSVVWLDMALLLPPFERNRAPEAWFTIVDWDAIALGAHNELYRSVFRQLTCCVLARPDLVALLDKRRQFIFVVRVLNALGVQRQHLKDAGVPKALTEELLALQQKVRQHMKKKAARERQQARAAAGDTKTSVTDGDAEDDDKLDDMHSLLEMMYGNLDDKK